MAIALAAGTAGELDGSRQLPSNRAGMRPGAGEPRQRTTLRRGRLGNANCKPTGLAAHGSSGRPAPRSEPICGRHDEPCARSMLAMLNATEPKTVPVTVPPTAN